MWAGGNGYQCGLSQIGQRSTLNTIGTESNAPIAYDTGTEHHHSITSTLGRDGGCLKREIHLSKMGEKLESYYLYYEEAPFLMGI